MGTEDDYKTAQEKLDAYFSPKENVDYEILQFRQAVQQPGETVDQFATRLRKIAVNCDFHDVNKEIKAAIIQNCQLKGLRRYSLRQDALTLEGLLAKVHSLEASEMQAIGMEKSHPHTSEEVNRVHHERQAKLWEVRPQQHVQVHVQAHGVSADSHGRIRRAHVLQKERPAEYVESQTTLQKCAYLNPQ